MAYHVGDVLIFFFRLPRVFSCHSVNVLKVLFLFVCLIAQENINTLFEQAARLETVQRESHRRWLQFQFRTRMLGISANLIGPLCEQLMSSLKTQIFNKITHSAGNTWSDFLVKSLYLSQWNDRELKVPAAKRDNRGLYPGPTWSKEKNLYSSEHGTNTHTHP